MNSSITNRLQYTVCVGKKRNVLLCPVWPQLLKYMGSHSYCTCWAFSLWCKCLICTQTWTQRRHQKTEDEIVIETFHFYSFGRGILLPCHCFFTMIWSRYIIPTWFECSTPLPRRLSVYLAGWVVDTGRRSSAHFRKSMDTPGGQHLTEAGSLALRLPVVFTEV